MSRLIHKTNKHRIYHIDKKKTDLIDHKQINIYKSSHTRAILLTLSYTLTSACRKALLPRVQRHSLTLNPLALIHNLHRLVLLLQLLLHLILCQALQLLGRHLLVLRAASGCFGLAFLLDAGGVLDGTLADSLESG